jgi:hypothetical protein
MSDWSRNEKIALYSLLVAILGIVVMLFTVPEFRRTIGLNSEAVLSPEPTSPTITSESKAQSNLTLRAALEEFKYEHGWTGGAANEGDTKKVSYYQVTNVRVNGNLIVMNYAWKNGIFQGSINGRDFTGTWQQSDGQNTERGNLFLRFNEDYTEAKGWWRDGDSGESGASYLRRTK